MVNVTIYGIHWSYGIDYHSNYMKIRIDYVQIKRVHDVHVPQSFPQNLCCSETLVSYNSFTICRGTHSTWGNDIHYLVGGLEHFLLFPYIGNNHPNWLIFFRGVAQPPTSIRTFRDGMILLETPLLASCWVARGWCQGFHVDPCRLMRLEKFSKLMWEPQIAGPVFVKSPTFTGRSSERLEMIWQSWLKRFRNSRDLRMKFQLMAISVWGFSHLAGRPAMTSTMFKAWVEWRVGHRIPSPDFSDTHSISFYGVPNMIKHVEE